MNYKDQVEEYADDLGQTFEEAQNTLAYEAQKQLMRYITDPNWMQKQMVSRGKFKLNLLSIANRELKAINLKYEKAFRMGLKNATDKPSISALKKLEEIKRQNAVMIVQLANQIYQAHNRWVVRVEFNSNGEKEIGSLDRTNALYNEICKVMNSKEAQEEVKAVYSDGKKFTFRSYMEMNMRTTMNQEIAEQQMQAAVNNGNVFWLCNNFEDCRPSHMEYQGRVYYDERYMEMGFNEKQIAEIEKAIAERGMLSRQQVENNDPWLGNCPNCRHVFVAVPIDEVVSMTDTELLKENNMNVDHATNEKYLLSQKQRYLERRKREYRLRVENKQELLAKAPKGSDTTALQNAIERDKAYVKGYSKKIGQLVKDNPWMERDYKRENARIIREDAGARHNDNRKVSMTTEQTKKALDDLTRISIEKKKQR